MDRHQASLILEILDVSTTESWAEVKKYLRDRDIEPEAVVDAWKALETLAQLAFTSSAPALESFE